ncbi:uncharacterized protein HKW66_Vig0115360 [Vigna angularis]|uniref:Uncharacterized protein n=1 Tax=Phaseolus angularis TaxID=3914 RepID=A0A8T0KY66_PHAAN|nr:uncharacterized protein HKW66_Vig0115360 [Vigna angularis]
MFMRVRLVVVSSPSHLHRYRLVVVSSPSHLHGRCTATVVSLWCRLLRVCTAATPLLSRRGFVSFASPSPLHRHRRFAV